MKIALIHTVQSVLATFGDRVKEALGDVKINNTLDEFLASDAADRGGEFTVGNMNRLFSIVKCAEMEEPDAIVVTCSTLSPTIEKIRPFIRVPLITIDEAMIKKAAEIGGRITILATAESTIRPTRSKLLSEVKKLGKEVDLNVLCCTEAYDAIRAGDKELHDEVLKRQALEIKQQDVVILAQASMAHMEEALEKIIGCTVLSSPKQCINQLKETLYNNK